MANKNKGLAVQFTNDLTGDVVGSFSQNIVKISDSKSVIASSYNSTYVPQNVNDGSTTTCWRTTSSAVAPQWVMMDLGASYPVNKLRLYNTSYMIKDFQLHGSNDQATWDVVYTGQCANTGGWQDFPYAPAKAYRYYRVYCQSKWSVYFQIYEMELYYTVNTGNERAFTLSDSNGTAYKVQSVSRYKDNKFLHTNDVSLNPTTDSANFIEDSPYEPITNRSNRTYGIKFTPSVDTVITHISFYGKLYAGVSYTFFITNFARSTVFATIDYIPQFTEIRRFVIQLNTPYKAVAGTEICVCMGSSGQFDAYFPPNTIQGVTGIYSSLVAGSFSNSTILPNVSFLSGKKYEASRDFVYPFPITNVSQLISSVITWTYASNSVNCSATISTSLNGVDYTTVLNGGTIPGITAGQNLVGKILYVKISLATTDIDYSPVVSNLRAKLENATASNTLLIQTDSFNNATGILTLAYNKSLGSLSGASGAIDNFTHNFTPIDLSPSMITVRENVVVDLTGMQIKLIDNPSPQFTKKYVDVNRENISASLTAMTIALISNPQAKYNQIAIAQINRDNLSASLTAMTITLK